jgi:hypothetical protein
MFFSAKKSPKCWDVGRPPGRPPGPAARQVMFVVCTKNLFISFAMQFVRDFLFTDICNHLEFFQFIQNLGKDDDVLLISLLELLSNPREPLGGVSPFSSSAASFRHRAAFPHRRSPPPPVAATHRHDMRPSRR